MHLVVGILANKDADLIVSLLASYSRSLTFVPVADHPHHDPGLLAQRFGGKAAPLRSQRWQTCPPRD